MQTLQNHELPLKPGLFTRFLVLASKTNAAGMRILRLALVVVLVWIGGLKFANYEADGIVPLVANSPLMSFFYRYPAPDYRQHMNREGEIKSTNRDWQVSNGTYGFAHVLGCVIVAIGLMIACFDFAPGIAAVGSFLLTRMSCTTLSFLITTPEAWIPALGDTAHGFPYLSIAGRLIIKDLIMLGAAVVTMADAAQEKASSVVS
jgi:reactive chlorine resistance protein C